MPWVSNEQESSQLIHTQNKGWTVCMYILYLFSAANVWNGDPNHSGVGGVKWYDITDYHCQVRGQEQDNNPCVSL